MSTIPTAGSSPKATADAAKVALGYGFLGLAVCLALVRLHASERETDPTDSVDVEDARPADRQRTLVAEIDRDPTNTFWG